MPVQIKQLHRHFVGEVSGVDLRKPLTPQEAADIEAGMDRYAVLIFHGQDISDDGHPSGDRAALSGDPP